MFQPRLLVEGHPARPFLRQVVPFVPGIHVLLGEVAVVVVEVFVVESEYFVEEDSGEVVSEGQLVPEGEDAPLAGMGVEVHVEEQLATLIQLQTHLLDAHDARLFQQTRL